MKPYNAHARASLSPQICVPRMDSVSRLKLGRADFESHILQPVEESHSRELLSVNNKVRFGDL